MKLECIEGPQIWHSEFIIACELTVTGKTHVFTKENRKYLASFENYEDAYNSLDVVRFNIKLEKIVNE